MKANWSVLALYDNAEAQQLAVQFCDRLVQRFWGDCGFDLSWCDWAALEHPGSANEASRKIHEADLIIVAPSPGKMMPLQVRHWLESLLRERGERERAVRPARGCREPLEQECEQQQTEHDADDREQAEDGQVGVLRAERRHREERNRSGRILEPEVAVRNLPGEHGHSSIGALASIYYMIKILLALFVDLFRRDVAPLEDA